MTDVRFDSEEEELRSPLFVIRPLEPPQGYYQFIIKLGLAKDNEEAGKVMAIVAMGAVVVAILYPFIFGS